MSDQAADRMVRQTAEDKLGETLAKTIVSLRDVDEAGRTRFIAALAVFYDIKDAVIELMST